MLPMASKNLDKGEKEDSIRSRLTSHTAATCASPCLSIIIVVIYMCAPSMQWGNRAPSIGGHILRGHHLRCIQVGGRCLRNWTEAGDRNRPSGRIAAGHLSAQTIRLALALRHKKLYIPGLPCHQSQTIHPPKAFRAGSPSGELFHCNPVELMKKPSPSPRVEPPAPASMRTGCQPE